MSASMDHGYMWSVAPQGLETSGIEGAVDQSRAMGILFRDGGAIAGKDGVADGALPVGIINSDAPSTMV